MFSGLSGEGVPLITVWLEVRVLPGHQTRFEIPRVFGRIVKPDSNVSFCSNNGQRPILVEGRCQSGPFVLGREWRCRQGLFEYKAVFALDPCLKLDIVVQWQRDFLGVIKCAL